MIARDPTEEGRSSTPLEAFFDLCFVVPVAAASAGLHEKIAAGQIGVGVLDYALVFFGIWWAWMNFSWFASAYDVDDVPYRLLTLLQIVGVLVLAAGIPAVYRDRDFTVVTIGYVVMRVAMITQWLRAARNDPRHQRTAVRYAIGIGLCQVGWVLRLFLPGEAGLAGVAVLVACELLVPWYAERAGRTTWNAEHISERFGLFTIIVVGESVAAATVAMTTAVGARGVSVGLVALALGGLVLVFAVWWGYFKHDAQGALAHPSEDGRAPRLAFFWGYLHYGIFAAIAAIGAGLELALGIHAGAARAEQVIAAYTIAAATGLYLVLGATVHTRMRLEGRFLPLRYTWLAAVVCQAAAAVSWVAPLPVAVCAIAAVVLALLAGNLVHAELHDLRQSSNRA
jgi:low temperature requirement protein LtrA